MVFINLRRSYHMGQMLKQLWLAFTVLFTAFEKSAGALNHLATWAEESAGTFADEARISRAQRVAALEAQGIEPSSKTAVVQKKLPKPAAA
jgi:hypothetical protein